MESTGKRIKPDTVCPVYQRAVELIGRRWTGVILFALLDGATRFSDIRDAISDISDRMLSERLKEMEADGIVEREVIPEKPVRIEYRLTAKGYALRDVVASISAWAGEWEARPGERVFEPEATRSASG
ncbi:MAG: winged helix-turn-helix transcriptional regulator [Rubrobacter sp.]